MRFINKSAEPQSLTKFNLTKHTDWLEIHEPANQHVYDDCLMQCLIDQAEMCGYTEYPLSVDSGGRHIDHFVKRAIDPRKTFHWDNMVAAVHDSRFGSDVKDSEVKSVAQYNTFYSPFSSNLAGLFVFSTDGYMSPQDKNDAKAIETIRIFNLNHESLMQMRSVAMEHARVMLENGFTKEQTLTFLQAEGFLSAVQYELDCH